MPVPAAADTALVAVASNFVLTAQMLVQRFESRTAHRLTLTPGSTGKLYAQILHGAPYDLLLAADEQRPRLLEQSGQAVAGSRFTYAFGQLVLLQSATTAQSMDGRQLLRDGEFSRLAMANPELAPYGLAALETLRSIDALSVVRDKLVFADNVGQAFAMFHTGNVDLAFVAAAQLEGQPLSARRWPVPDELHAPIRQDVVLLQRAGSNPAAREFLQFLRSGEARALIVAQGYRQFDE